MNAAFLKRKSIAELLYAGSCPAHFGAGKRELILKPKANTTDGVRGSLHIAFKGLSASCIIPQFNTRIVILGAIDS